MPSVPVIGYLTRSLEPNDTYNLKLWELTCTLAQRYQRHLLMICGQVLGDPEEDSETRSAIYRLVGPELVDGAVLSQTVIYRASPEDVALFDKEVATVPMVSFSIPLGDRPTVTFDNAQGLRLLLRHLIDEHGRRRIVHVRGPLHNQEAAERERVWREELLAAGIEPRREWLIQGDFDIRHLSRLGEDILESAGTDFDAVFACNDLAAFRVLEDFARLGIRVPEDVSVVGFDNLTSSEFSSPSLTTVAQPFEPLMEVVWSKLEALLHGQAVSSQTIGGSPVYRASCGCGPTNWSYRAFPLSSRYDTAPQAVSAYEAYDNTFRWKTYDTNRFYRALHRVAVFEQVESLLADWLPRLGFAHYAVYRCVSTEGVARAWRSTVEPGTLLPTAPQRFRLLAARPEEGLPFEVPGSPFSLGHWGPLQTAGITGLFPLVVGGAWFGLLALQLSSSAGLHELAIQEQMAALFDRLERESAYREADALMRVRVAVQEETSRTFNRLVAEVAHEVNTPLAAIVSSGHLLEERLKEQEPAGPQRGAVGGEPARVSRKQRKVLADWLVENGVNAPGLAEELVSAGFDRPTDELLDSLRDPGFGEQLKQLVEHHELRTAARIVTLGAEKIDQFVAALRKSTEGKS